MQRSRYILVRHSRLAHTCFNFCFIFLRSLKFSSPNVVQLYSYSTILQSKRIHCVSKELRKKRNLNIDLLFSLSFRFSLHSIWSISSQSYSAFVLSTMPQTLEDNRSCSWHSSAAAKDLFLLFCLFYFWEFQRNGIWFGSESFYLA